MSANQAAFPIAAMARVLGVSEEAPGIGISRQQLASASTARLAATVVVVPGVDLGGLVVQLVTDLLHAWLDPRVRIGTLQDGILEALGLAYRTVVLCTGAWLGGLARQFGVRQPVQAGRTAGPVLGGSLGTVALPPVVGTALRRGGRRPW